MNLMADLSGDCSVKSELIGGGSIVPLKNGAPSMLSKEGPVAVGVLRRNRAKRGKKSHPENPLENTPKKKKKKKPPP